MTQKLKQGDKVIVARPLAFSTQRRPVVAIFWQAFPEGTVAVKFADRDHPVHFRSSDVAPYSDALWAAWQQLLRNAQLLEEQQKQLRAGRVPQELLTIGMW